MSFAHLLSDRGLRRRGFPAVRISTWSRRLAISNRWLKHGRRWKVAPPGPPMCFRPIWCSAWAKHYAKPGSPNELCILTGYQDGALVFVWPLMKTRNGPFTVLRWMSEPFAQYGDVLLAQAS